jgi:methylmalonyl-CoA mutase C-terminal domain/subunit
VLLAKPGLDGHDRGVKVIARACRDAGFEVIYTGIRQSSASIAETAIQEDVDVVGLSVLSGAHLSVTREVIAEMRSRGAGDIPVLVGGTIPSGDEEKLRAEGAGAVFGVSTRLEDIIEYINGLPRGRDRSTPGDPGPADQEEAG